MKKEEKKLYKIGVSFSGGVDSTTALWKAIDEYGGDNVIAISFDYGQRHKIELQKATRMAAMLRIKHKIVDLSSLFKGLEHPLIEGSKLHPEHKSYEEQIKEAGGRKGRVDTYVPFRNGLFISACVAVVDATFDPEDEKIVMIGAHKGDFDPEIGNETYADCSREFVDTMAKAAFIGTYGKVRIEAPFADMSKKELVAVGKRLGIPYQLTYSCYEGENEPCGECGTCLERKEALK